MNDTQNIKLSAVAVEDNTYRITTSSKIDGLVASIRQIGLIHPPIVKQSPSGYLIISGFRRIAACDYLGWKEFAAQILDADFDVAQCIYLAIVENALQRPLNLIEIFRCISLLSSIITDERILTETASKLGLPSDPGLIRKIKKIGDLDTSIQEGILTNTISLAMVTELAKLEPNAGVALTKVYARLKIGLNRQREFMMLLDEIAHRENSTIANLLNEGVIQQVLDDHNLDRAQKRRQIQAYLRQRRFPAISRMKNEFNKQIKKLQLGNQISLTPPKDFEGSNYTLKLTFSSLSEFEELQSRLDRIIQSKGLSKFLTK
ncbi:MAG: ParB N-terminal domain-containing protein [Desulfobacterales bacterium]